MKRHVWITPKSGEVGSGKGKSCCLSCGLIRWVVGSAGSSRFYAVSLYGRDGIHWVSGPPQPRCEPTRG